VYTVYAYVNVHIYEYFQYIYTKYSSLLAIFIFFAYFLGLYVTIKHFDLTLTYIITHVPNQRDCSYSDFVNLLLIIIIIIIIIILLFISLLFYCNAMQTGTRISFGINKVLSYLTSEIMLELLSVSS